MAKTTYKSWGKHKCQTVRQHKTKKNIVTIRKGEDEIDVRKCDVDSLIVTLLRIAR